MTMSLRWSKGKRKHSGSHSPVHTIKRGIASLFVCLVVLLPLILAAVQVKGMIAPADPRRANDVLAMQTRQLDKSSQPLQPFDEPLITVTFDDGWESIYSQALPMLQSYGIPTTQYVLSGTADNVQYMNYAQMRKMAQAGHEIGCHSIDHADLTKLTQQQLDTQLRECKAVVGKELNMEIREFASPYGSTNPTTIDAIMRTYNSHRNTVGDIWNSPADDHDVNTRANFKRYDIICVTLRRHTTPAQLQAAIDYAVKNNGWLVLNYHQIEDDGSEYGLNNRQLDEQLQIISKANARITTIGQTLEAIEARERR